MIQFDLPKSKSSILKVLGVGGGGSNAVNYMFKQDIESVDFIICNTDAKALEQSNIPNKIQLGPHLTQGLGAGANPQVGKQATEESLEEIRRILEVNTKMAFITAGMGGGTGTGGAPIIAQICRDLGILTVGIVTTPFGFEGPRRLKQAEEGIRQMQPFVDTLLVISNDKLRMQYGNLKMTEAFAKADNVLATAAKCITDIINSRGTIIVDFADVCTVMKNGGVAILGSATAEGENRAQKAIEEALNSPLLNDSDIKGAKWILVNINSGEGENECTMDEFEIINNHLRLQSGENSDLIIGTGYDATLGDKIGITIIATGFEFKDPFEKKEPEAVKKEVKKEEKIIMTLGVDGEEKKMYNPIVKEEKKDPLAPELKEEEPKETFTPSFSFIEPAYEKENEFSETAANIKAATLNKEKNDDKPLPYVSMPKRDYIPPVTTTQSSEEPIRFELTIPSEAKTQEPKKQEETSEFKYEEKNEPESFDISKGFLSRPKNIYADNLNAATEEKQIIPENKPIEPVKEKNDEIKKPFTPSFTPPTEPQENLGFQLIEKEEKDETIIPIPDCPDLSDEEDQKRRATDRINKLRNLSYNMNGTDGNSDYDNVPAYVRRNMELFGNALTSVEKFYSKVTVKKDENDETKISTINTFLDGKKPD